MAPTLSAKHDVVRQNYDFARFAGERRRQMAAAVDAAGAALGALGMLAFAIVFSETSIAAAFMGASFAWLAISVVARYVRRKTRSVRSARTKQGANDAAIPRSH